MIPSTKIEHAVKTQIYRWYNGYERYFTTSRISNQLELLANDISITTPKGTISGKANYPAELGDYRGIKISHKIEEIEVIEQPNGLISLNVNVVYQGVQKDGTDNCLKFKYENELEQQPNQLPVFKAINLSVAGIFESPTFTDSYPRIRSLALMHYYLFLIEKLDNNAAEFQEILSDDFQLNLSKETLLNSIDGLANWLNDVAQKITVTNHYPKNIEINVLGKDTYELTVEFDWEGWTKTAQKMIAKTKHKWVIIDKKNDRFAKIQSIDVEQLIPFSIV